VSVTADITAKNITVSADITAKNVTASGHITAADVILSGADCAEEFDIANARELEPGTVVVFNREGAITQSILPYNKRVAEVISGAGSYRPGVVLGRFIQRREGACCPAGQSLLQGRCLLFTNRNWRYVDYIAHFRFRHESVRSGDGIRSRHRKGSCRAGSWMRLDTDPCDVAMTKCRPQERATTRSRKILNKGQIAI
jgi:hypothetical protein